MIHWYAYKYIGVTVRYLAIYFYSGYGIGTIGINIALEL